MVVLIGRWVRLRLFEVVVIKQSKLQTHVDIDGVNVVSVGDVALGVEVSVV